MARAGRVAELDFSAAVLIRLRGWRRGRQGRPIGFSVALTENPATAVGKTGRPCDVLPARAPKSARPVPAMCGAAVPFSRCGDASELTAGRLAPDTSCRPGHKNSRPAVWRAGGSLCGVAVGGCRCQLMLTLYDALCPLFVLTLTKAICEATRGSVMRLLPWAFTLASTRPSMP